MKDNEDNPSLANGLDQKDNSLSADIAEVIEQELRRRKTDPRPQLVHNARMSLLRRAARKSNDENPEREQDRTDKFERHAISATLDLCVAEARIKDLESLSNWRDIESAPKDGTFLVYMRAAPLRKRIQVAEDRKSTRLNSSHIQKSRMPSSA